MAQIVGFKVGESVRKDTESKNVESERGSSALHFTAEAPGQRGDAKLSSSRRQGLE